MFRTLVVAALAALVLATPAEAKRVRLFTPVEKLARADAVVVGKVTAIEKEPVTATPAPGVKEKASYRVAVVKVESALTGAADVTHVKIGFEPVAADGGAPVPPRRGGNGFGPFSPTVGDEGVFFLTKHHAGDFYTVGGMLAPVLTADPGYKDQLAAVNKAAAVLADPMKALKAEQADDRTFAAVVLVTKYRAYPESGGEVESVKLPADESARILGALAAADWKAEPGGAAGMNAYQAFGQLRLADADGWKPPQVKPGEDFIDMTKEAFVAWLAGPGKDYRVSRLAPKKPGK